MHPLLVFCYGSQSRLIYLVATLEISYSIFLFLLYLIFNQLTELSSLFLYDVPWILSLVSTYKVTILTLDFNNWCLHTVIISWPVHYYEIASIKISFLFHHKPIIANQTKCKSFKQKYDFHYLCQLYLFAHFLDSAPTSGVMQWGDRWQKEHRGLGPGLPFCTYTCPWLTHHLASVGKLICIIRKTIYLNLISEDASERSKYNNRYKTLWKLCRQH